MSQDLGKLVFDIGLNNGEDAAYYLHLGYRVVGVDADPRLTAQCVGRFESEIAEGRMAIVNAGILETPGEFVFYRNILQDGWSSFTPDKRRPPGEWEEIKVPCITTRQLIESHGQPFFMKVDIEGTDIQSLSSLTPAMAPPYVSLELDLKDPTLERLISLEYSSFKIVNGETYRHSFPVFDHEIGWRLLRKAGRAVPLIGAVISKLPPRLRPKSEYDPPDRYNPHGYPFTSYCSGPFGEQADGEWMSGAAASHWLERLRNGYRKTQMGSFWWDIHARHSSYEPRRPGQ